MTTTEQLRAPLQKWVTANCHISTCAYEETKYNTILVNDCNCGLEDARAALALPVEPAGPSAIQVNELRAKCAAEPGGFSGLSNSEIASVVTLLSENDFDTSIVLRVAIALQSAVEPSPDADCQQCGHLMRWHDPSNGIDDTHACVQCALIAANSRIGSPSPDVLAAADTLATSVTRLCDPDTRSGDRCPRCLAEGLESTIKFSIYGTTTAMVDHSFMDERGGIP